MKKVISAYLELTKPRITLLVLMTTAVGYCLGAKGAISWPVLCYTIFGAGLACSGASTLNQYLERDVDSLMLRTARRPIPQGTISAGSALSFGICLVLLGIFVLCLKVNLLTAFLSLLTTFLYVIVYTPMKRLSWLNTIIGAIPGALPPVGGWTAAGQDISMGAVILFLILFVWQHPHFFAIAWMCREDYQRGNLRMLPVVHPDGKSTFLMILFSAAILIPISLLPIWFSMAGYFYLVGTLILGIGLFLKSIRAFFSKSIADARGLLKFTVIYLPLVLLLILADSKF